MKMGRISVATMWIFLTLMMGKGKCSEDKVFAINGCNATLEWELGNASFVDSFIAAEIFNTSGSRIAWVENGVCEIENNVSVFCEKRNRGECQLIYVVLFYVTQVNSGRYACRIKYNLMQESRNFTKELIIIDKLQIVKPPITILNDPLDITCTVDGIFKGVKYQWKLNGTDLYSMGRIYANSSILRFERLWTADKSSIFACEICEENSCCIKSETFTVEPYYGPDKVDLDHNERDIYLNENENFTVKCVVDCNPVCAVWWEGYINSNNEVLAISSFDSRMAGAYICIAKHLKTNKKAHSETIFLHHGKVSSTVASSPEHFEGSSTVASTPKHTEGLGQEILWMGPVIVSVFLLVIICLMIVRHRRENKCGGIAVQQNTGRRTERLECRYVPRKPRSFQNLLDLTKHSRNQIRESTTLQTLSLPSNSMERKSMNRVNSTDLENKRCSSKRERWPCCSGGFSDGSRLDKHLAKLKRNDKLANDGHSIGVKSQALDNSRQEDLYSTIDEDALWVYDYARDSVINDISRETEGNTEYRSYDYARSIEICQFETADVHATNDAYITPISDFDRPIKAFYIEEVDAHASERIEVQVIDGNYITPITGFSGPFEICQVEETDVNETDQTYITPITG